MATKSIQKSVRLSESVYDYIMLAPGKGFNEKVENIILEAKVEEKTRRSKLDELNIQIEKQQRKLYELFERYRYLDDFLRDFLQVYHRLIVMRDQLKQISEDSEPTTTDEE